MASHTTNPRDAVVDMCNLESSSDEDRFCAATLCGEQSDTAHHDTIDLTNDNSSKDSDDLSVGICYGVARAGGASSASALTGSDSISEEILGSQERKAAPSALKTTGLYEVHDVVEATPPSPPASSGKTISLKRGYEVSLASEELVTGRDYAEPSKKKSRESGNTKGRARDNNWKENFAEAEAAYNNSRFSDVVSGDPRYGWMDRAKKKRDNYDSHIQNGGSSAAFDRKEAKKGGAWTTERINLVRPLVEAFEKRRGSRGKPRSVQPSSRFRSESSASLDSIASVNDVDDMAVKQCKNWNNQDLYVKLLQFTRPRIQFGKTHNNKGHVYQGKRRLCIAKLIMGTKLHVDSTAKVQKVAPFVGNGTLAAAFSTYFQTGSFPDECKLLE